MWEDNILLFNDSWIILIGFLYVVKSIWLQYWVQRIHEYNGLFTHTMSILDSWAMWEHDTTIVSSRG